MTMKSKIFDTIVINNSPRTASQLASRFWTTRGTVIARISELRKELRHTGYTIESYQTVDTVGRICTFYRRSRL